MSTKKGVFYSRYNKHHCVRFHLNISYDQYLDVYQGLARTVIAYADDGRKIVFPAGKIQPFLDHAGIHGYFEMELTAMNNFIAIRKLA